MAQSSVTDFFSTQKKKINFHPSKRQKLSQSGEIDLASQVFPESRQSTRKSVRISSKPTLKAKSKSLNVQAPADEQIKTKKTTTQSSASAKPKSKIVAKSNSSKNDIRDVFEKQLGQKLDSDESSNLGNESDKMTASCDDHQSSPPSTPTKRAGKVEHTTALKRSRKRETMRKDLLQELDAKTPEGYDFTSFVNKSPVNVKTVRKKLVMRRKSDDEVIMNNI